MLYVDGVVMGRGNYKPTEPFPLHPLSNEMKRRYLATNTNYLHQLHIDVYMLKAEKERERENQKDNT